MEHRAAQRLASMLGAITAAALAGCATRAAPIAQQPRDVVQLQRIAEEVNATAPDYTLGSGDALGIRNHAIYTRETLAVSR